jgi:hypothetical protein
MVRVPVQFSSVQFSSVQFKWRPSPSLPDPPARAIGRARATARAAQLAWLDEWCWHGLLTVVPRVERVRPTSDELWRSGVFGLTRARLGGKLWLDKGPSRRQIMAAGAAAARGFEGVTECASHPAQAPSHACVCARDTGACNMPWVQQRRCLRRTLRENTEQQRVRPDSHTTHNALRIFCLT